MNAIKCFIVYVLFMALHAFAEFDLNEELRKIDAIAAACQEMELDEIYDKCSLYNKYSKFISHEEMIKYLLKRAESVGEGYMVKLLDNEGHNEFRITKVVDGRAVIYSLFFVFTDAGLDRVSGLCQVHGLRNEPE